MRIALIPFLLLVAGCARRPGPLPVYGSVPDFTLISQTGEAFHRKALEGKVWVADFIYTTCSGPCPRMSSLMRQVQSSLEEHPEIKLVSFTVDPENDTPPVLARYAQRYHAEPGRWFFLTGARATLQMLSREAFKLSNVDRSMDHSTRLVLIDARGRIRGYYGTSDENPVAHLLFDIRRVLKEQQG